MRIPYETIGRTIFAILMVVSIGAFGWVVGFASPWFGLVASFSMLGLLDLAMPFAQLRLPASLREVRAWELRGGAYRLIGVPVFGALLRGSPVRFLNQRVYLGSFPKDLPAVRTHSANAEAAHFWGGVATIPYLALAWSQGWWVTLGTVLLFNLVVNIYPILHLRSVRARIDRVLGHERRRRLPGKNC